MASSTEHGGLIFNRKLSSVGPGLVTGKGAVVDQTGVDLAMKLHYLRIVYYFPSRAFQGVTVAKIKEPMFFWLNHVFLICGRFRRSESGRPCIKCNDCGVRLEEAQCAKSLEEWLEMKDASLEKLLVSDHFIGPDLSYSPLVFLQYTKFKCGGMAVGLSWPHVLGDVFSAVEVINFLGQIANGNRPSNSAHSLPKPQPTPTPNNTVGPLSIKRVDPVGDKWITVNNCKLEPFSFDVTPAHWKIIDSKFGATKTAPFESLCAVIWKIIAEIRHEDDEPKIVTICKKDGTNKEGRFISKCNSLVVIVVEADFSVAKASYGELAALIANNATDEREMIEDAMERELGLADFVVYGANLTFVNMEGANFYGFEYQGEKPVRVSCTIDGVGDRGAVLVLPAEEGGDGRCVTVVLPEMEVVEFKSELENKGLLG